MEPKINMDPMVLEYIQNLSGRNNRFACEHIKDHCGRLLAVMDYVVAEIKSDEGVPLLVPGHVEEISYQLQLVKVQPFNDDEDDPLFEAEWLDRNRVIRVPYGQVTLRYRLTAFFSEINRLHGNKAIHKNGQKIQFFN